MGSVGLRTCSHADDRTIGCRRVHPASHPLGDYCNGRGRSIRQKFRQGQSSQRMSCSEPSGVCLDRGRRRYKMQDTCQAGTTEHSVRYGRGTTKVHLRLYGTTVPSNGHTGTRMIHEVRRAEASREAHGVIKVIQNGGSHSRIIDRTKERQSQRREKGDLLMSCPTLDRRAMWFS